MKRTTQPIVTGTSVVALKYADGVMMAADTLGSYGSLARFTDLKRLRKFGESTLIGASGDYSDFQYVSDLLEELVRDNRLSGDAPLSAREIHRYLTRVMYNRRNKQNPLWNSLVCAGVDEENNPTLGVVDLIGTAYEEDHLATGFGGHLATPILRKHWRPDLSEKEARKLLEDCMRVLYYRDCRTMNKIMFATVKRGETPATPTIEVSDPVELDTKWDYASFVRPKAASDTGGSW